MKLLSNSLPTFFNLQSTCHENVIDWMHSIDYLYKRFQYRQFLDYLEKGTGFYTVRIFPSKRVV